jgi:hypothetical protein
MTVRMIKTLLLTFLGWLIVTSIPGLARYLKIRET